ncbi:MAG: (d)CMP kinase [Actinobacteria bacterium]|nr:(d)CMP kinase [Actinomycetota bacterium]
MTAVAIDGPAGAGKSTVARAVADALGFTYVDTGAMYRAIALRALERGIDPADAGAAAELASSVDLTLRDGGVYVDGRDVTGSIRSADVTRSSAQIATHAGVRAALVEMQRRMASAVDVVMEGRDIGTHVLPNAPVKVFLTASLDERAHRRAREVGADDGELDALRTAISERDEVDRGRVVSPLAQAPDAVVIDTTGRSVDEVVAEIVDLVTERS